MSFDQSLIHRYRDEAPPILNYHINVLKMLDSPGLIVLQDDLRAYGCWVKEKTFSDLHNLLPSETGLYMFIWNPSFKLYFDEDKYTEVIWPLYVGRAKNNTSSSIKTRFKNEYSKYISERGDCIWKERNIPNKREKLLKKWLTLKPLEFWYLSISEVEKIDFLEKRLISQLNPPLNTQHTVTLTFGEAESAF